MNTKMNPSTLGWIDKYYANHQVFSLFPTCQEHKIVEQLRSIGFTYGLIDIKELPLVYNNFDYTQEELSKIMYLQLLEQVFGNKYPKASKEDFFSKLLSYYQKTPQKNTSLIPNILKTVKTTDILENELAKRWQQHFFTQNTSNDFVINMILLYIDIICFEAYITHNTDPIHYKQALTHNIARIIIAFNSKHPADSIEEQQLVKYLKKSLKQPIALQLEIAPSVLRDNFIADFICCNSWDNLNKELILPDLSLPEFEFITLEQRLLTQSKIAFLSFVAKHNNNYNFYRATTLVNNVISNATSYVETLLKRNKIRLIEELQNNKELMELLYKSTNSTLSKDQKKMVKTQIISIVKTIPSLAIFILPGGSLLLPILLKFIPSLLPNAFNENSPKN